MKRAAIWLGVAVLIALSVDALGDLTQNRPDVWVAGSRSEIVVELRERNISASPLEAAQSLWAVCQGTISHELVPPGVVPLADGRFLTTTDPALGKNSWRRLKGCLEDATIDKVIANVVSKSDTMPGVAARPS
jgi:hypothetical protein